jgi:oxepin-CoA hydrolase/3-oxo-5,6-dehydrosuberyl-CoA semialdehyde dehydrogenase
LVDSVTSALSERLAAVDVAADMGALVSRAQRDSVQVAVDKLRTVATVVFDGAAGGHPAGGAFFGPVLLQATDARAPMVHTVEAFGPVATVIAYHSLDEAAELAALGEGSLVGSIYAADPDEMTHLALAVAADHGRLHLVDATSGPSSTGHGSPVPGLIHGGPGRAGGSEELGGLRAVTHYLQRTALQGSPDQLSRLTGQYVAGASRNLSKGHPFKLYFEELAVGDSLETDEREITLADIEAFADLTGDTFYAHMDDNAGDHSPIFDGRVAHGYLVVAAAAGLFVWPDPGPVLANYGLERLRFAAPTYPGDRIKVRFTAKSKKLQAGRGYGEVSWDTQVINQHGNVAAAYDVLTLVACQPQPGDDR